MRGPRVHVRRLDVLLMYAVPLVHWRRAGRRRHVVASLRGHVPCWTRRWRVVAPGKSVESVVVLVMLLVVRMLMVLVLVMRVAATSNTRAVVAQADVALARSHRGHLALRRVGRVRLRVHQRRAAAMLARRARHLASSQHVRRGNRTRTGLHHLFVLRPAVLEPDFNLKRKIGTS